MKLKKPSNKIKDETKKEVVVFLEKDYSVSDSFTVDSTLTKEDITKILNEKYGEKGWFYYDIW
jgi:hypothetical protein